MVETHPILHLFHFAFIRRPRISRGFQDGILRHGRKSLGGWGCWSSLRVWWLFTMFFLRRFFFLGKSQKIAPFAQVCKIKEKELLKFEVFWNETCLVIHMSFLVLMFWKVEFGGHLAYRWSRSLESLANVWAKTWLQFWLWEIVDDYYVCGWYQSRLNIYINNHKHTEKKSWLIQSHPDG